MRTLPLKYSLRPLLEGWAPIRLIFVPNSFGDKIYLMRLTRYWPDLRIAVVGAPAYFAKRPKPNMPQDLAAHDCINLRLPTHGGLLTWEFERKGHAPKAHVKGQWMFNVGTQILPTALAGFGLAYLPRDMVAEHVAQGRLVSVLQDWSQPFPGYHLYYPSRQASPAFKLVVDALRYRE